MHCRIRIRIRIRCLAVRSNPNPKKPARIRITGQNHIIYHNRFPITSLKKWWVTGGSSSFSESFIISGKSYYKRTSPKKNTKKRPPEVFKNANKQPLWNTFLPNFIADLYRKYRAFCEENLGKLEIFLMIFIAPAILIAPTVNVEHSHLPYLSWTVLERRGAMKTWMQCL